ncbi:flagellar hook protein FlgE [Endothiovibrio diazotrophicus]
MSFNIALSGLNVALSDLSVTGNNIANSSTTGFKESRAEFADVYAVGYQGISGNAIGNGVRLADVAQQHSQGNINATSNSLDLAINGQGFFVLSDGGEEVYTRSGAFGVDGEGYIVNSGSQRLQAFPYNEVTGTFDTAQPGDIQLESGLGSPANTNDVSVGVNLLAAPDSVFDPADAATAFDRTDPTTYHYSTSVTLYDSVGSPHIATMYYRKTNDVDGNGVSTNTWESYLYMQDSNGDWQQVEGENGASADTMTFSSSGQLETINGTTVNTFDRTDPAAREPTINYGQFEPANGAEPMGDGTSTSDNRLVFNYAKTTQYNSDFSVQSMDQNGYTAGRLSGMDVDGDGTVYARYSNGQSQILGRVALANFTNPQGLNQLGDTSWAESSTSGQALKGEAGTGNFGSIQSGALEASNVELTEQLVKMITAQRNFQANSQMLSTEDQVTQTMLNLR